MSLQDLLSPLVLSAALTLGACTADQTIPLPPDPDVQVMSQVQAHNVLVEQGANGSLTIDAEINGEAWTYRVHRDRSGNVGSERLTFPVDGIDITVEEGSIEIDIPHDPLLIYLNDEGTWSGYHVSTQEPGTHQDLTATEVATLRDQYDAIARSNYALARELLDIDSRIVNTVIPSDYDEMTYALTWMPTPDQFNMELIDGCRDMLQVTTSFGFTYLYGSPFFRITDSHGEIIFSAVHGYELSGDYMLIAGRNTEISELHGERDYNHDIYSEGEAGELLGRARQLHREFFQFYAPRARTDISRHFLRDYTRYMPRDEADIL